jgi:hypothetical protein
MIHAAQTMLKRIRGASLALPAVLCLIAAAAPLAHATRVEVHQGTEIRYTWANSAQLKAAPETETKSDTPRLIQLVTDNWDVSSGVHIPHIDVPQPVWTLPLSVAAPVRIAELHTPVCDTGPPLGPICRGPPVL